MAARRKSGPKPSGKPRRVPITIKITPELARTLEAALPAGIKRSGYFASILEAHGGRIQGVEGSKVKRDSQ